MTGKDNIKVDDQIHIIIAKEMERLFKLSMSNTGLDTDDLKKLDTLAKIYRQHGMNEDDNNPLEGLSEKDKVKSLLGALKDDKEKGA